MSTAVLSNSRFDVHHAITHKIVKAIEAGAGEFVMPWHSHGAPIGRPQNAATRRSYKGVNVVGLWAEAMLSGYRSGVWATFRQWRSLGAAVRRGQHGTVIVFYKMWASGDPDEGVEDDERGPRLMARASIVFNAAQVAGWSPPRPEVANPVVRLDEAEAFVAATQARIHYGSSMAYYRPGEDLIEMPDRASFVGTVTSSPTEAFYATLLHELTHWTRSSRRLNRTFSDRFKDEAYAFEELVAELGAAFLCGDLGITNDPRRDHAAYLTSWLKVLRNDHRAIFDAARYASSAAEYLTNFSAPK